MRGGGVACIFFKSLLAERKLEYLLKYSGDKSLENKISSWGWGSERRVVLIKNGGSDKCLKTFQSADRGGGGVQVGGGGRRYLFGTQE